MWQYYPYTSVLEYKILKNEVKRFIQTLEETLKLYGDIVIASAKEGEKVAERGYGGASPARRNNGEGQGESRDNNK